MASTEAGAGAGATPVPPREPSALQHFQSAAAELLDRPTLEKVEAVRKAVSAVVADAAAKIQLHVHESQDRRGRTIRYHVIQAVQQQLQELEDILSRQRPQLDLLRAVDRLRGLILDLYR